MVAVADAYGAVAAGAGLDIPALVQHMAGGGRWVGVPAESCLGSGLGLGQEDRVCHNTCLYSAALFSSHDALG